MGGVEGMAPLRTSEESTMDNRELSILELNDVSGGDTNCKVTEVKDINMGIFGTIHIDTLQCGGGGGPLTAVSYSPYKPA
jgi:hypothetical protein